MTIIDSSFGLGDNYFGLVNYTLGSWTNLSLRAISCRVVRELGLPERPEIVWLGHGQTLYNRFCTNLNNCALWHCRYSGIARWQKVGGGGRNSSWRGVSPLLPWDVLLGSCHTFGPWATIVWNKAVCKTQMPPFPNMWRVGLTFDLDLWPTDLNVNRDHPLIKDYLPTKFEASGAKRSRVIHCTRFERLTWPLTFDLLTWLSIGIIYSSRDYLPTKFEASGAKRCWVIRCTRFGRLTWPLTLTCDLLTWLSIGIIYSSRTIYLPSLKLLGQSVVELSVAQG